MATPFYFFLLWCVGVFFFLSRLFLYRNDLYLPSLIWFFFSSFMGQVLSGYGWSSLSTSSCFCHITRFFVFNMMSIDTNSQVTFCFSLLLLPSFFLQSYNVKKKKDIGFKYVKVNVHFVLHLRIKQMKCYDKVNNDLEIHFKESLYNRMKMPSEGNSKRTLQIFCFFLSQEHFFHPF